MESISRLASLPHFLDTSDASRLLDMLYGVWTHGVVMFERLSRLDHGLIGNGNCVCI